MDEIRIITPPTKRSHPVASVLIGLIASILIWILTPYNNFVLFGPFISDGYLPLAGLFLVLAIVVCLNPMLRMILPRLTLSRQDMGMIFSIVLIASVLPGQGLFRTLPYTLAAGATHVRENPRYAETFKSMNLPSSLFPETMAYGAKTPVADFFVGQLPPGESIPWAAWIPPLLTWGAFLIPCYLMMMGLALVIFPQWRNNERLLFPLLAVQESLIEEPEEGRLFAPLFRKKSFWIAAILVFGLHFMAGWKLHAPTSVPAIPMNWTLSRLFADGILRYVPTQIHTNRIYFMFFGIAYFMPGRIGFSLWFTVVAYAIYVVFGNAYFSPFDNLTMNDHRFGGMIALTIGTLWLGRTHWLRVFRNLFRRVASEEDRRDRTGGRMLLGGALGMFLWLSWVGVQPLWALAFIVIGLMISLTITRLVAETGMPFIRIDMAHQMSFLRQFPNSWLSCSTLFFSFYIVMIFAIGSRVSCSTMTAHAIGLNEKEPPRTQTRLCWMLLAVIAIGIVIAWAGSLAANYHNSATLDGKESPVSAYSYTLTNRVYTTVQDLRDGRFNPPIYNQRLHLGFGFVAVALLQWASLVMPRWPLHPIGIVMVNTYYLNEAWVSVFLGWFAKVLLVRYGGLHVYRAARPFFMGLIIGEVLAGVFWCLASAGLVYLGIPYQRVQIQPY